MKNFKDFKNAWVLPVLMFIAGFFEMYQHGFEQLAIVFNIPAKYVELFRGLALAVTIAVSLLVKPPKVSPMKMPTIKRKRKPKEPAA